MKDLSFHDQFRHFNDFSEPSLPTSIIKSETWASYITGLFACLTLATLRVTLPINCTELMWQTGTSCHSQSMKMLKAPHHRNLSHFLS